ncbi:MAG: hypothetical protein ACREHG_05580, partial [Candidatus Saccharimonadales bacterium]
VRLMSAVPFVLLSHRKNSKYKIPRPSKPKNAFASFYTKFRASRLFLYGLCSLILIWLGMHWWLNIDKDFGALNLFLSAEASISLAFFTLVAEMQDKENRKLEYDQEYKLNEILEHLEEHAEMPFQKLGPDKFKGPAGKVFDKKQVQMYYANGGKFPNQKPKKGMKRKRG